MPPWRHMARRQWYQRRALRHHARKRSRSDRGLARQPYQNRRAGEISRLVDPADDRIEHLRRNHRGQVKLWIPEAITSAVSSIKPRRRRKHRHFNNQSTFGRWIRMDEVRWMRTSSTRPRRLRSETDSLFRILYRHQHRNRRKWLVPSRTISTAPSHGLHDGGSK